MKILGCDLYALPAGGNIGSETGEMIERRLVHDSGEA